MRAKTVSRFKKKCCLTGTVKLQTYSIHIVFASLIFYKTSFLTKEITQIWIEQKRYSKGPVADIIFPFIKPTLHSRKPN